ncbi:hypothetical protein [Rudaeicoccus suwonensis]|uniref:Uncharacterized protein n=1 Tax=Rudaeicoccus suwonensis TaxID=657409 RepID=A0A561E2X3_9MICO|nr:hypothetical protein [Rudaeicoccus suwonensis]TWE09940.1 hypothetical protein BKA23_2285 [Rudaeicoccus suwonensis]
MPRSGATDAGENARGVRIGGVLMILGFTLAVLLGLLTFLSMFGTHPQFELLPLVAATFAVGALGAGLRQRGTADHQRR